MNKVDFAKISDVANLLKGAQSVLFVTGAGVSADSGLPTYRGIGGLYEDKVTDEGIPIEMALAGQMLKTRPEVTWKYLYQIEKNLRSASFNRAHEVMALMEKKLPRVCILTQNIDGFHNAAGSTNVIDIHGDMHRIFCEGCGWKTELDDYSGISIPPKCPKCETAIRPDVVFFGEMLPQEKLEKLDRELDSGFDVYFSVGTTSVFAYIQQPILNAKSKGMPTVEINPGETAVSSYVDIKISLTAAEAMDAIWTVFCHK